MTSRVSFAFAAALLAGCGASHQEPASSPEPDPVAVRTAVVDRVSVAETVEAPGTVAAQETVVIAARIPAYIQSISAREGDFVPKGRTLVRLDSRDLSAAVEQAKAGGREASSAIEAAAHQVRAAEAQLDLARSTYERFDALAQKDSVTKQELDEATARVRQAEAGLQAAKAQQARAEAGSARADAAVSQASTALDYSTIVSPVSGRVVKRHMDPGSLASPGMPILEIERAGAYRLEVSVPESQAAALRMGETLPIRIDALGDSGPAEARIVEIVPTVDPASRSMTVKLALPPSPALRSGLFGRAVLPGPEREAAVVPGPAVVERGQIRQVYVVSNGRAVRRLVQLGRKADAGFVVQSGLEPGDEVILDPSGLADGVPVRPTPTRRGTP